MRLAVLGVLTMAAAWENLVEVEDPRSFAALVWVPPAARGAPESTWPLLVYLHGAGESGRDLRGLISEGATGTPPVALERGVAIPALRDQFVVAAPQTSFGWAPEDVARFVDFFLAASTATPRVDAARVYVTGHSMGGSGALHAATTGRFAACAPVAPAGSARPHALRGVPIWAFHGANDAVIPSAVSERLVAALRKVRPFRPSRGTTGRARAGRRARRRRAPHGLPRRADAAGLARQRRPRLHAAGLRRPGALRLAPLQAPAPAVVKQCISFLPQQR